MKTIKIRDASQRRWQELWLLILPCSILVLEMGQLLLVPILKTNQSSQFTTGILPGVSDLIPALGLIAALIAVHFFLTAFFSTADQILLPIVGLLSGLGMLMATRLGPSLPYPITDPGLGTKQLTWVILGLMVCCITIFLLKDVQWLRKYKYTAAALGLFLVALTIANSLKTRNLNSPTHDQLSLGHFFNLQPSELLKICIVIFFAAYLSENGDTFATGGSHFGPFRLPPLRQLGPLVLILGISLLFFLVVRELGLALLIYGIFLSMMYLGTGKLSYVFVGFIAFLCMSFIAYELFGYVRDRFAVVTFDVVNWQSWNSAQTYFAENPGLQIVQAIISLSSGGLLGAGLGLGHPTFVPVVQSDMVFSAISEEYGFVGDIAILALYLLLIYRGFRIAIESNDTFSQLLASGLTSIFVIQSVIIIAGNMKFFPLTGIPLPFLSYGGSSILANYIIIGILLRISYENAREKLRT
jgi:cell division protein FtsW (lipid II flippase)